MKRIMIIIFIIFCTIIGCIIGESVADVNSLKWLSIGAEIGFKTPLVIDISFLTFTIGIWCKLNICGGIFLVVSSMISGKVFKWIKV